MILKFKVLAASAMAAVGINASIASAATVLHSDREVFSAQLGASLVDTYSPTQGYPLDHTIFDNESMSAVVGETVYASTRFSELNIVGNVVAGETDGAYCAGCNGSFLLNFSDTSFSSGGGVYGVGFDVDYNRESDTYAYVTFSDNSSANYLLAPQLMTAPLMPNFFGLTSSVGIASIHVGALNGAASGNTIAIDNLQIGSAPSVAGAVPEPSTWAMMLLGFGFVGGAMRSAKRRRKVTVSYA